MARQRILLPGVILLLASCTAAPPAGAPAPITMSVDQLLDSLSVRDRVAQLIMPWIPGTYAALDEPGLEQAERWVDSLHVGGIIISVGSPLDEAAKLISSAVDQDANIIFGAIIDEKLVDQIKITVIATGFDETKKRLRELSGKPAMDTRYGYPRGGTAFTKPAPSQSPIEPPTQPTPTAFPPSADEVPPEEDEFDIPAFLRQRS